MSIAIKFDVVAQLRPVHDDIEFRGEQIREGRDRQIVDFERPLERLDVAWVGSPKRNLEHLDHDPVDSRVHLIGAAGVHFDVVGDIFKFPREAITGEAFVGHVVEVE